MKLTDLKREHFPNGQAFSKKALDQYLAAKQQVQKDFFTRYLLSIAVGVVVGFLVLTFVPQGFFRIFLAMIAVMLAAMIGTRLTAQTLDNLKVQTEKVNITRKDMRIAKAHLKNGTTAWQPAPPKKLDK